MPYCSKCGAKLDKDAKFCPRCGTPAGPPVVEAERRKEREPISTLGILAIILIIIVGVAAVVVALAFLPVRTVGPVQRRHSVPHKTGVNTLRLDFIADVAHVNIAFEDLTGEVQSPSIILDASATAKVGAFVSPDVFDDFLARATQPPAIF